MQTHPSIVIGPARAGWIAAAALAAAGCGGSRAAGAATTAVPTVAVVRVERAALSRSLTLAAEFQPFQEVDIHAKVAGYVKSIFVDVGDHVKAGQPIAVLEVPELRDEMQQDEAAVQRSAEEINRAQAEVERAQSAHEMAHLGSVRLAGVLKSRPNLVAQQDLDDAAGRDRMAEAQVATAKAGMAAAQQQLAVSKASASRTRTLLEYTRIVAPFTGVVTHRYADTGAMIQAGTSSQTQAMPVVKLSQNDRLRLVIEVPESAVARIHLGERVDVRVDAVGRSFPGTIARFSDKVNPETRTMRTEVDVDNAKLTLVPGMYADATLALDQARDALTAPVQAVDRTEDGASVFVVKDGRLERRPIVVGLEAPDRVEVRSGLAERELVVVGSRSQLKPGEPVNARIEAPARAEKP